MNYFNFIFAALFAVAFAALTVYLFWARHRNRSVSFTYYYISIGCTILYSFMALTAIP